MPCSLVTVRRSLLALFCLLVSSCRSSQAPPSQTVLLLYRFDPPAFVEYSTDLQPVREIPFSIPAGCGLFNLFPSPLGQFLLIELSCPSGQTVLLLDIQTGSTTQPVTDSDAHFLAWTSDGKAVYLKVDSLGSPQIIRVYGDRARDVLAVPEFTYDLSAEPGSRNFTFTLSRGLGHGSELFFAEHDGRITTPLYSDRANYISFARFSPDGRQIAFIKIPDTQTPFTIGELWIVNSDGSKARKLADADAGHGYAANWSPDGRMIAFVVRENPEDENADQSSEALISNIYVVDVESGEETQVTDFSQGRAETPLWSPRGNTLVFNAVINGRMHVFVAAVDPVGAASPNPLPTEIRSFETGSACCPAWMRK